MDREFAPAARPRAPRATARSNAVSRGPVPMPPPLVIQPLWEPPPSPVLPPLSTSYPASRAELADALLEELVLAQREGALLLESERRESSRALHDSASIHEAAITALRASLAAAEREREEAEARADKAEAQLALLSLVANAEAKRSAEVVRALRDELESRGGRERAPSEGQLQVVEELWQLVREQDAAMRELVEEAAERDSRTA